MSNHHKHSERELTSSWNVKVKTRFELFCFFLTSEVLFLIDKIMYIFILYSMLF